MVPQNAYKEEEGRFAGLCKNSTSVKKKTIGSGPPRPSSGLKGDFFASEGQRTWNKRPIQEIEDGR